MNEGSSEETIDIFSSETSSLRRSEGGLIKEFRSEEGLRAFLRHHIFLKEKGFPVPQTARKIEGKREVLVTDLSEGGTKRVVSTNETSQGKVEVGESLTNLEKIREELKRIARKADDLGIIICSDAYFLVIEKLEVGQQAKVVLGDLGAGVCITEEEKQEVDFKSSYQAAELFYRSIATAFSGGKSFPNLTF